ncbi:hypothetical protein M378DRAFT_569999 [Amanita muscaria Koide BX008]|uniref:Uncharacterized protein n=1 Tax=Amanita muscaria (strain Koide BX008) TaxID=946122 RepID=A0A0C2W3Q1_AMAMK|nr:hypothetical protein M378DRAFT_569999 [Amanita muscaria Koide BX008]
MCELRRKPSIGTPGPTLHRYISKTVTCSITLTRKGSRGDETTFLGNHSSAPSGAFLCSPWSPCIAPSSDAL